ncbi:hypothetical protein VQ02_27515 [Methylobacterium variabile]|uniref:Uncharacterized protein n=1 Tax=Methylobacterium variabile TaxID=298794 RepID=A0A0J6S684_9HYPH|nr:hypothetical protein [Methylobacterium variabile]KMO30715.1 hypothetical protein VQ02_27515 [Methylobacterium variabile]
MGERTGRPRGRPKGAKSKHTREREAAVQAAAEALAEAIPEAFDGDAHALLMAVYKDPRHPIELRLDAAGKAIKFEKPALASVEAKVDQDVNIREPVDRPPRETREEWNARKLREMGLNVVAAAGAAGRRH